MTDTTTVAPAPEVKPVAAPADAPQTAKPAPTADTVFDDIDVLSEGGVEGEADAGYNEAPAEADQGGRPAWARPADEDAANEWREERGVPLEPDDYELPIADPDQLTDTGRETIQGFQEVAFALDLPKESASKLYEFTAQRAQEIMAARVEQDRTEAAATKQALADQWGDRANDNLKSVNGLLKTLPADLSKAVREARLANGLGGRLANNSAFLQLLADYASLKAGGQSVGVFDAQADDARILQIERVRDKDFSEYIGGKYDRELTKLLERKAARTPPTQEAPLSADAKREAVIMKAMRANYDKYKAAGMDVELTQIRQRRGAQ